MTKEETRSVFHIVEEYYRTQEELAFQETRLSKAQKDADDARYWYYAAKKDADLGLEENEKHHLEHYPKPTTGEDDND